MPFLIQNPIHQLEKVGVATGEELQRQKEQLLRTEGRLDEINNTLKTSERHLNGIKSVFGGIKNYLFAKNAGVTSVGTASPSSSQSAGSSSKMPQSSSDVAIVRRVQHYQPDHDRLDNMREENHPALRSRGLVEPDLKHSSVDQMLDQNLEEMAVGLSRLKGLAMDLHDELDEHDDIIIRVDDKASHAGIKVNKQNKDIAKILKK